MALDLKNPKVKKYYDALMKNIRVIKKIDPDFEMTDEQIEEMLSPERIEIHERAQTLPVSNDLTKKSAENALKFIPGGNVPPEFARQYYYMADPGDGPEAEEYNKKLFQNIDRDDAIGHLARTEYILESLNLASKVDIELLKKNPTEKQLFEMSIAFGHKLSALMESEHMLSQQNYFNIKEENEPEIKNILEYTALGSTLRDYNELAKSDLFLTMPFKHLSEDTYQKVLVNIKNFGDKPEQINENLNFLSMSESQKSFFEKTAKSLKKTKVFTSNDFNNVNRYRHRPKGFDARRQDLLEFCHQLSQLKDVEGRGEISAIKASAKTLLDVMANCDYYPTEEQQKSIVSASDALGNLIKPIADNPFPEDSEANQYRNFLLGQYAGILGKFKNPGNLKSIIEYQKSDDAMLPGMEKYLDMLNICMTGNIKTLDIGELKTITNSIKNDCLNEVNKVPKDDLQTLYRLKSVGARIEIIEQKLDGVTDPSKIKDVINSPADIINLFHTDNVLFNFKQRLENVDKDHKLYRESDENYKKLCQMADILANYSLEHLNRGPLSKKEIDQCEDVFNEFNFQIRTVIDQESVSPEIRKELERSLRVFETFEKKLHDAYGKKGTNITYDDVVTDPSWMEDLFVDKFATVDIQVKEPYRAENQPFWDNVKEYRESAKNLRRDCETHIKDMFGTGDPKEIRDRLQIVQDYIDITRNDAVDLPEIDILGITKDLEELKETLDLSKITEINENTLITYKNWEKIRAKLDPIRRISDDKLKNMSPKMVRSIKALGEKLSLKPNNLHISAVDMQKLDSLGNSVWGTVSALNLFLKNKDRFLPDDENKLGPLSDSVNLITAKVTAYINGSSTELPTPEEYQRFNEGLKQASAWVSVFNDNNEFSEEFLTFPNYLRALKGCGIPEIANGVDSVMKDFGKRCENIAKGLYSDVLQNKASNNGTLVKIKGIINTGSLSVQTEQKLRFACMAVNASYRDEIVQQTRKNLEILSKGFTPENTAKLKGVNLSHPDGSPKTFADIYKDLNSTMLVGELFKREYAKYEALKNTKSSANYAIDDRLAGIYKQDTKSNDIKAFGAYIDDFIKSPGVQNYINSAPDVSRALYVEQLTRNLYGGLFLNTLSGDTLEALTQNNRKYGRSTKENSPEYAAISNAIKEIRIAERIPSAEIDYTKLYGALSTYITNRDLNPGTDAGKERCYAAEEALVRLGTTLMETKPEMKEQIERELKIACLRSNRVREMLSKVYGSPDISLFAQMVKDKLGNKDFPASVKDKKSLDKLLNSQREFFTEPSKEEAEFRKLYAKLRPLTIGNPHARSMQEAREVFMSEKFRSQHKLGMDFQNKSFAIMQKSQEYGPLGSEGPTSRATSYLMKTDGSPESEEYNKMLVEMAGTKNAAQIYGRHVVSQLKNISLSAFYLNDYDEKLSMLAEHGMNGQLSFVYQSVFGDTNTIAPAMADFYKYNKTAYEGGQNLPVLADYAGYGFDIVFNDGMDMKAYLENDKFVGKYLNPEQNMIRNALTQKLGDDSNVQLQQSIDMLQEQGFFDQNLMYMKAFRIEPDGKKIRINLDDAISGYSVSKNIVFERMNRRERNALDVAFEKSLNLSANKKNEMPVGRDFKEYLRGCYNKLKDIPLDTCRIKNNVEILTNKLSRLISDMDGNIDDLGAREVLRELRPEISKLKENMESNVVDEDTKNLNKAFTEMSAQMGEFIASVTMKEFAKKYPQPTVFEMNPDGLEAIEVYEQNYKEKLADSIGALKGYFKDYNPREDNPERNTGIKMALASVLISEKYLEVLDNLPDNAGLDELDNSFGDKNYQADLFSFVRNGNLDALVKSLDENEISKLSKGEVDKELIAKLAERNEEIRAEMDHDGRLKEIKDKELGEAEKHVDAQKYREKELGEAKKYVDAQKKIDTAKFKHAEEVRKKFNEEKDKLPKTKEEAIKYLTQAQHKMQQELGFHFANIRYEEIGVKPNMKYHYMQVGLKPEVRQESFIKAIRSSLVKAMVCKDNIMELRERGDNLTEADIQKLCSPVMREEKRKAFDENGAMHKLLSTKHGITAEQYMALSIGSDGTAPNEQAISNADNALADITSKFKNASIHWDKPEDVVNEYKVSGKAKVQADERNAKFKAEEKVTAEMQLTFNAVMKNYKHALTDAALILGIDRNPVPKKPEANPKDVKSEANKKDVKSEANKKDVKPQANSKQPKNISPQMHKNFVGLLLRANYFSKLYDKRFDMPLDEFKNKMNYGDAVKQYIKENLKAMDDFVKAQPKGQFEKNLKEMNDEQFRRYIRDNFKDKAPVEKADQVKDQGLVK